MCKNHSTYSFSRFLAYSHPNLSKVVLIKNRNLMMVCGIWVYALGMVAPTISGIYGTFGYNKDLGKCDYISIHKYDCGRPRQLFYSLGFGLPLILIVISYFGIWRTTIKSGLFLKPSSSVFLIGNS